MPYIDEDCRKDFDPIIELITRELRQPDGTVWSGDVNYVISRILFNVAQTNMGAITYESLNKVIGVLECVKQEFYRRVVAEYEDTKREKNGDIYE